MVNIVRANNSSAELAIIVSTDIDKTFQMRFAISLREIGMCGLKHCLK